jgi:small conductance mechanosensitive channel
LTYSKAADALWPLILDGSLNFLAAIIILIVGWTIAGRVAQLTRAGLKRVTHIDQTLTPLVVSTVRYTIVIVTVMAVLGRFGVQTTSLIAMLGAAGLAIGLALQGTLSNVASGVMLLLLRPIRAGEEIVTAGYTGTVREVGLFRTILVTGDGLYASIPNATIFSDPIVNNSREPFRQISLAVPVDPSADVGAIQTALLALMNGDQRILKRPAPAVTIGDLGDISLTLTVTAWVATGIYGIVQNDLKKFARDALRKLGAQPGQNWSGNAAPLIRATAAVASRKSH